MQLAAPELPCSGCAHSASSVAYPGHPSGERPCAFCVRNPERQDPPIVDKWYDQSEPVKVPMDCYQTIDMKRQHERWYKATHEKGREEGIAAAAAEQLTPGELAEFQRQRKDRLARA